MKRLITWHSQTEHSQAGHSRSALLTAICLSTCLSTLTGCALASSEGTAIRLSARSQMRKLNWANMEHYVQTQAFTQSVDELDDCNDRVASNYRLTEIDADFNRVDSYAIATQTNLYEMMLFGQPRVFPWQRSGHLYSYVGTVHAIENDALDMIETLSFIDTPGVDNADMDALSVSASSTNPSDNTSEREPMLVSIVCQANEPGEQKLEQPLFTNNQLTCGAGSSEVARSSF